MKICSIILKKVAGIQNATFHCLRHTFVTRSLEAVIPAKTVSKILEHSNISITIGCALVNWGY